MAKNFDIEKREVFGNEYLKVFLKDTSNIENIKQQLSELASVKKINITSSKSINNPPLTLTVYPIRVVSIDETQNEIENKLKHIFNGDSQITLQPKIKETQEWLTTYPKTQKLFNEAIEKYKRGIYQRNVLDDMRLALETFLKEILKNQKSLEKQLSDISKFQNTRGNSQEFITMFKRLLDYYSKYQNNHVKHNDAVKQNEIDFVINLTILFMKSFSN